MSADTLEKVYLVTAVCFILALKGLSSPKYARRGNLVGAAGALLAVVCTLFLDGLQHYNYDTPVWFHEGFAHWMEREINPKYNTFDSGEGGIADMTRKENWKPEVMKLIADSSCPHVAEMMGLKSYAEFKLPHHFTTWSMIDFLIETQPENFGKFV